MSTGSTNYKELPVVRLVLARPFLDAALEAGVDVESILQPFGINSRAFENPDMFVPAATMYDIVEDLAEANDDPYIGAHLGLQLNPFQWSPLIGAAKTSQSVGDFFLRFSIDAYRDANSAIFKLETRGARSSFHEIRVSNGHGTPRHNDAFSIAYILQILISAVGQDWDGRQVIAEVCDPGVLPENFFGIRVATTNTRGSGLSFPCEWLLLKPSLKNLPTAIDPQLPTSAAPESVLDALQLVLATSLENPQLSGDHIASLCGMSRRTLSRKLAKAGTSLNRELANLRRLRAETYLADPELTVNEICLKVGYSDTTVFTRAFKRWTGMTPTQYRGSL